PRLGVGSGASWRRTREDDPSEQGGAMTILDHREGSLNDELLISADSHVAITHDQVRAHLAAGFHPDYDAAVAAFAQRMARGTAAANQAGMKMKRSDNDAHIGANAVFKRPG